MNSPHGEPSAFEREGLREGRGVRVSTLPNGLRVVSDTVDTVETVSVGVWVGIGTRHEDPVFNGVCHLLEHMVFKGTHRRDARAIAEQIEAVGGQLNAHTSREHTAYYAKVLKEDVALAVDIVADLVQNAVLDATELDRERSVIIQEILQSLDTPDDVIFDHFQATAFPDQALGRPVLGTLERIQEMPRQALTDMLHRHYGATRMVVGAAGRIEHDQLLDLVGEAFRGLPPGEEPLRGPARYAGGDWRDDRDLEQVHVIFGWEGVGYTDPDFYALSVLSTLLGGGMSSRLFQEAREERGLVYSIYTFPSSYTDGGLFGIYAGTGEEEVAELMPLVCDSMLDVCDQVSEDEVARARAQLKASTLMSLESTSARCEQLARQLMIFGRPLPVDEIVGRIEAVEVPDVIGVARRLRASPLTLTTLGPIGRVESYRRIADRLT